MMMALRYVSARYARGCDDVARYARSVATLVYVADDMMALPRRLRQPCHDELLA